MKTIIFRNPFVSKSEKESAMVYLNLAESLFTAAQLCFDNGDLDSYARLCYKATTVWNTAAKKLGFMSIKDMDTWVNQGKAL